MTWKQFFVFLLAISLLSACQSPANPADKTPAATFVANPQQVTSREVKTLAIGAPAPDFNLPGTDGKFYTLGDFKNAKALVVVFTCNHCPTAQAYEDRIIAFTTEYKAKGVDVVAISPNSPLGLLYEELGYSDLNDDFTAMQQRAADHKFNFPYLYDGDTESASLQYGPAATPQVFVFDQERKLRYTGRLDRKEKPGTANAEDLRAATDAVLAGQPVPEPVTQTFGCSTKWGWKLELRAKADADWAAKEVKLSGIDATGVRALLKNANSGKLRLINIWATWCGPCVLEYPDFLVLQRMYGARDFEFVSISADKVEKEAKVLEFLKSKQSGVTNYLFTEQDKYALTEAIGKDWNGALPYTALVEPGGKVVWQHQGEVDFQALKRTIVDHPLMGRVY
jgi:peroxiredoxin